MEIKNEEKILNLSSQLLSQYDKENEEEFYSLKNQINELLPGENEVYLYDLIQDLELGNINESVDSIELLRNIVESDNSIGILQNLIQHAKSPPGGEGPPLDLGDVDKLNIFF